MVEYKLKLFIAFQNIQIEFANRNCAAFHFEFFHLGDNGRTAVAQPKQGLRETH